MPVEPHPDVAPEDHVDVDEAEGVEGFSEGVEQSAEKSGEAAKEVRESTEKAQERAEKGEENTREELVKLDEKKQAAEEANKKFNEDLSKELDADLTEIENMFEAESEGSMSEGAKKAWKEFKLKVIKKFNKGSMKETADKMREEGRDATPEEVDNLADELEKEEKDNKEESRKKRKERMKDMAKLLLLLLAFGGFSAALWGEYNDNSGCAADGPDLAPGADHSNFLSITSWKGSGGDTDVFRSNCNCITGNPSDDILNEMWGSDKSSDKKCSDSYFYSWEECSLPCMLGNALKDGLEPVGKGVADVVLDFLNNIFGGKLKYVGYAILGIIALLIIIKIIGIFGRGKTQRVVMTPAPVAPVA